MRKIRIALILKVYNVPMTSITVCKKYNEIYTDDKMKERTCLKLLEELRVERKVKWQLLGNYRRYKLV